MKNWMKKAHRLISEMCTTSYIQANRKKNGEYYKQHQPYSVPSDAEFLLKCLNRDDELAAKRYFLYGQTVLTEEN